jgi:hypothetical protein
MFDLFGFTLLEEFVYRDVFVKLSCKIFVKEMTIDFVFWKKINEFLKIIFST